MRFEPPVQGIRVGSPRGEVSLLSPVLDGSRGRKVLVETVLARSRTAPGEVLDMNSLVNLESGREGEGPIHVALLVAEMAPLVKVGGLADVAGALPAELAARGARVTVILPAYGTIDLARYRFRRVAEELYAPLGSESLGFAVLESDLAPPGVRWYLIEHDAFFRRPAVYVDPTTKEEYADNALRFTYFTRASLEALRAMGDPVDVVHSHDHQTALASVLLDTFYRDDPIIGRAASVYTLHNLGYQGIHPPEILTAAGFERSACVPGSPFEYWGRVNFMKLGIIYADIVSTVSETYAREIRIDEKQGAGLDVELRAREKDLVGILNGVDVKEWDPAADPFLAARYGVDDTSGKRHCKRALLEELGFDARDLETPLVAMITRLVDQKGLDLVTESFDRLLASGARFVFLGTGLPKYEQFLQRAAVEHSDRVAARITFDNGLAHRIEAGADVFLMPSLYEPCGLNQMYSLRYGTVPVVRATGGLADTVPDVDRDSDGVGFSFDEYTSEALLDALGRCLKAYGDPKRWGRIVRRGMSRDLSWGASAAKYIALFRHAIARARAR
jgi:starch synthase